MSEQEVVENPMDIRERIYHYRVAGESITSIAKNLDISVIRCGTLYREFVTELAKVADIDSRKNTVALELTRLDALQAAHWSMAEAGDINASKMVLELMKQRSRLLGLEQLSPVDTNIVHSVLVVGNSTAAFLESLEAGRRKPELASADPDNDIEGSVDWEQESL